MMLLPSSDGQAGYDAASLQVGQILNDSFGVRSVDLRRLDFSMS